MHVCMYVYTHIACFFSCIASYLSISSCVYVFIYLFFSFVLHLCCLSIFIKVIYSIYTCVCVLMLRDSLCVCKCLMILLARVHD